MRHLAGATRDELDALSWHLRDAATCWKRLHGFDELRVGAIEIDDAIVAIIDLVGKDAPTKTRKRRRYPRRR